MSIYMVRPLVHPREISGNPILLAIHPSASIVAVASYSDPLGTGVVVFFDHKGSLIPNFKSRTRPSFPECCSWHPVKRLLAVAWKDGKVTTHDLDKNAIVESALSSSFLTLLLWNEAGSSFVGIDKANRLLVWNTTNASVNVAKPSVLHEIPQTPTCVKFADQRSAYAKNSQPEIAKAGDAENNTKDLVIGCKEGGVYYLNDKGQLSDAVQLGEPVCSIAYFQLFGSRTRIAYIMTEASRIFRYQINLSTNQFEEQISILIFGKTPPSCVCWLDWEVVAVASVESIVRVWDLQKGTNVELGVADFRDSSETKVVRTIAFNAFTKVLVASTNIGDVLFWQLISSASATDDARISFSPVSATKSPLESLLFVGDSASSMFVCADGKQACMLEERDLAYAFCYPLIAMQNSTDTFSLTDHNNNREAVGQTSFLIEGIAISANLAVMWGQKQVAAYQITENDNKLSLTAVGTFQGSFRAVGVYDGHILALTENSLLLLTLQGVTKTEIRFQHTEGSPVAMDIQNNFCIVATSTGVLKLTDLNKFSSKHWTKSKVVAESLPSFEKFITVRVNCDGTCVAFIAAKAGESTEPHFHVWDTDRNVVTQFDCSLLSEEQGNKTPGRMNIPLGLGWLTDDSRVLWVRLSKGIGQFVIATFFSTFEKGILLNSQMEMESAGRCLVLGCHLPSVYLYTTSLENQGKLALIKNTLPDFKGFDTEPSEYFKTVLNFSYFSSLGKVADALNTVKDIKAPAVWNHLAKLCVRIGRLEYAKICLGKLGRADILCDHRKFAETHSDTNSQLGHLAAMLHLRKEAENYYTKAGKQELIMELKQAAGDWEPVLKNLSSTTVDRLRRRAVLYTMAHDDLNFGKATSAVQRLVDANCERFDVPRLLLRETPWELDKYMKNTTDREILTWYARSMEAQNRTDDAMEYYQRCENVKSVVRLLFHAGKDDEALELVRQTKNKAAAFHLAQNFELEEETKPELLIELYKIASAYPSAIRICIQHEMNDQVAGLAAHTEKAEMISAAKYLESKGMMDQAISLYQKAGHLSRATDLAFDLGHYANIETISEEITEDSEPRLIQRCVDYFAENNQVDRAVYLLIRAKQLIQAVQLCSTYHMTIDEKLTNLVLERSTDGRLSPEQRRLLITKLAEQCLSQGLHHEAARLLIEVGRPEDAMNALVKTGDIDAISRYIRIIRDPDALIIAGNNLQALPWHQKRDIFDAIVLAYKRAGANLYLASFYDSWAETACDSGRYAVAKEAFTKSFDVIQTVTLTRENAEDVENAKAEVERKKKITDYFLDVEKESKTAPENGVTAAEELLKHTRWDYGVRRGHVFGLLIRTTFEMKALARSKRYFQQLKDECPNSYSLSDFVPDILLKDLR